MKTQTRFIISDINQPLIEAQINGISGNFLLDTGASNTCIDSKHAELFQVMHGNNGEVAGIGPEKSAIKITYGNAIQIGDWKHSDFRITAVDLGHLNANLVAHGCMPVEGIIGSDLLIEGRAVIDYDAGVLKLESGT